MKIYIDPEINKVKKIIQKMKNDEVFIHYTGTVYGIGANAFNEDAVSRVRKIKERDGSKGFIILISHPDELKKYSTSISSKMSKIMHQYWPGNLTIVLPVENEFMKRFAVNNKVAFRVPNDPLLLKFIELMEAPIISTSVNKSGENSINDLNIIQKEFGQDVDFALVPAVKYDNNSIFSTIITEENESVRCLREGSIPFYEIQEAYEKPLILFVCTGNICRSPIAEYLARKKIEDSKLPIRIASAGILESGVKISENSYKVLKEHNIDAGRHLSQTIDEHLIRKSWIILTMEQRHKKIILELCPEAIDKTFTLSEYTTGKGDIADPYQLDISFYRKTYIEIEEAIDSLLMILKKDE